MTICYDCQQSSSGRCPQHGAVIAYSDQRMRLVSVDVLESALYGLEKGYIGLPGQTVDANRIKRAIDALREALG